MSFVRAHVASLLSKTLVAPHNVAFSDMQTLASCCCCCRAKLERQANVASPVLRWLVDTTLDNPLLLLLSPLPSWSGRQTWLCADAPSGQSSSVTSCRSCRGKLEWEANVVLSSLHWLVSMPLLLLQGQAGAGGPGVGGCRGGAARCSGGICQGQSAHQGVQ